MVCTCAHSVVDNALAFLLLRPRFVSRDWQWLYKKEIGGRPLVHSVFCGHFGLFPHNDPCANLRYKCKLSNLLSIVVKKNKIKVQVVKSASKNTIGEKN